MKFFKIILLPLSFLYGSILALRNKFYDWGLFKSTEFKIPIISVGNLSLGGTGKTPHIEYLIRLLKPEFEIATLSRGYGRKTKGFILSDIHSTNIDIGDEPLQFKHKYSELNVAVDGNRVRGINKLLQLLPNTQSILLDDAFQHRAVKPGLSIVLTDFSNLYLDDYVVPSGTLREFRSGIKRADIIIVTKCPKILVPIERKRLIKEINPLPHQTVYFSFIKYGEFLLLNSENQNPVSKSYYAEHNYSILLLTGIANTQPLENYLRTKVKNVVPVKFPDHHQFTKRDLGLVQTTFHSLPTENKIILTTEKDAMRLKLPEFSAILDGLPIFYMPIEINFYEQDKIEFNEQILHYVRANKNHHSIYSK
jgi:tetraacyldisaccharide 4'-kinase